MIEDPIAVSIKTLEQNNHGEPKKFNELLENMINGKSGEFYIENARRLLPKVISFSIIQFKKLNIFQKLKIKKIVFNLNGSLSECIMSQKIKTLLISISHIISG